MLQHEFSYWLHVKAKSDAKFDPDEVIAAGQEANCFQPNGPLVYHENAGSITAEIDPNQGTIPEDLELEANITKMAAALPSYELELTCLDEEDNLRQRLSRYYNGQEQFRNYARLIPCDEIFDELTVRAVIDYVQGQNQNQLADQIAERFLPSDENERKGE